MKRKSDQKLDCLNDADDEMEVEPSNDDNGPVPKKARKRTSAVWNHFSINVSDVDGENKFSRCNYCEK